MFLFKKLGDYRLSRDICEKWYFYKKNLGVQKKARSSTKYVKQVNKSSY